MIAYTSIIISLGICVVLPVLIVWLIMRKQTNDTNKRTEIILAALEKNPNLQIEEFIKQLNPPKRTFGKTPLRMCIHSHRNFILRSCSLDRL